MLGLRFISQRKMPFPAKSFQSHPPNCPKRQEQMMNPLELRPQQGPQEQFLRSAADIAIYGGAAGGGKSFALLLEPLFHVANSRFRGVLFRRTVPQLRLEG